MSIELEVVILAAGIGSRMASSHHKLLHCVGGRSLLSHVYQTALSLNPQKVSVIAGHQSEVLFDTLSKTCEISAAEWISPVEPKGTGYAVRALFQHSKPSQRVLVLYGDVPLVKQATLEAFIAATPVNDLGVITTTMDNPFGFGRIIRGEAGIQKIVEEKDATAIERQVKEINTGIFLLPVNGTSEWLDKLEPANAQGEYYLTDIVELALRSGVNIAGYHAARPDEFLGVNTKTQLAAVERVYQHRQAERLLDQGVTLRDPARVDIRGTVQTGLDVIIDVNVVLEGAVTLGDGVTIEPFCHLKDVTIAAGTLIRSFTHIDGAVIDESALVGPFARLRPGTELRAGSRIGNFVEIKKSVIGQKSKVNHLSYIGDTTIGSMVNIGAGTVTCNFDGKDKHETVIHSGASVGSGTMLVAPLTVGEGATIGAGSVLTKSAPAGQLTVARAKQTTIKQWVSPQDRNACPSIDEVKS